MLLAILKRSPDKDQNIKNVDTQPITIGTNIFSASCKVRNSTVTRWYALPKTKHEIMKIIIHKIGFFSLIFSLVLAPLFQSKLLF